MISRICGAVAAGVFPPDPPSFQAEEPQRHQRQGHMMMPANPASHLVVGQADLSLGRLEHLLDPVAFPLGADGLGQRNVGTGVGQGVIGPRLADGADGDQPLFRPIRRFTSLVRTRVQVASTASGPFSPSPTSIRSTATEAVWRPRPRRGGTASRGAVFCRAVRRRPTLEVADGGVPRHVDDVPLAARPQRRAELGGPAELVVAGDPAVRRAGEAAIQQVQGDPPFHLELDLRRDVALGAVGRVEPQSSGR